jgi:hypothetical protein
MYSWFWKSYFRNAVFLLKSNVLHMQYSYLNNIKCSDGFDVKTQIQPVQCHTPGY